MRSKKTIFIISFLVVVGLLVTIHNPAAATIAELETLLAKLQAQIAELQRQLQELKTQPAVWCHDFNMDLRYGDAGSEVEALQTALEKEGIYEQGDKPSYFGEYVSSAVVGFQEKYKEQILFPLKLKYGTGYVGRGTRAKLNLLYGCGVKAQEPITKPIPTEPAMPVKSYIRIIKPNGGERLVAGESQNILWESTGVDRAIVCVNYGPTCFELGGMGTTSAPNTTNISSFHWYLDPNAPYVPSEKTKIKVTASGNADVFDESDNYFGIIAKPITTCTDSDGGKNYYLAGTMSDGKGNNYPDYCFINSNYLLEYFCASPTELGKEQYLCPNGCANGACLAQPVSSITVVFPNGGEQWMTGNTYNILWKSTGLSTATTTAPISISLLKNDGWFKSIASGVADSGGYSWTIPSDVPTGRSYKVEVLSAEMGKFADSSDGYFTITGVATAVPIASCYDSDGFNTSTKGYVRGTTTSGSSYFYYDECSSSGYQVNEMWCYESPAGSGNYVNGKMVYNCPNGCRDGACLAQPVSSITVISPNGGEQWEIGSTHNVLWQSTGMATTDQVSIYLWKENDPLLRYVTPKAINSGSYFWMITSDIPVGNYKVEINGAPSGMGTAKDTSDGYFSIVSPCSSTPDQVCPSMCSYQSDADCCTQIGYYWLKTATGYGCYKTNYNPGCSPGQACSGVQDNCCPNWCYADSDYDCCTQTPGRCWTENRCSSCTSTTCTDSDNGKDFYTKGICTDKYGSYTDACEGSLLKEHVCANGICNVYYYACPTGCNDGTCKPSIFVTTPNGGEQWTTGSTYNILWKYAGTTATNAQASISLSKDNSWFRSIVSGVADSGSYSWTVPADLPTSSFYKVEVISASGTGKFADSSDGYFTITSVATTTPPVPPTPIATCTDSDGLNIFTKGYVKGKTAAGNDYLYYDECSSPGLQVNEMWCYESPAGSGNYVNGKMVYNCENGCRDGVCLQSKPGTMTVVSPNGREQWTIGNTYNVLWQSTGMTSTDQVSIYLWKENDSLLRYVTPKTMNSGSYPWTITSDIPLGNYKVEINGAPSGFGMLTDTSDGYFTITSTATTTPPVPSGKPDLAITSLVWPTYVAPNKSFTITITIKNIGSADKPYGSVVYAIDTPLTTPRCIHGGFWSALTPGESITQTFSTVCVELEKYGYGFPEGTYEINAMVDYDGVLDESDETNNALTKTLVVGSGITPVGSLSLTTYWGYPDWTFTSVPQQAAKLAHFYLAASSAEAVNLSSIAVNFTGMADAFDASDDLSNLYVVYAGGPKTEYAPSVSDTGNKWAVNYQVPAGKTIDMVVFADIGSTATDSDNVADTIKVEMTASGVGAVSGTILPAGPTAGQNITVSTATSQLLITFETLEKQLAGILNALFPLAEKLRELRGR